jgi:hypothetical protein
MLPIGVDLSDVIVTKTQFGYGIGVSKITKQYLSARGAIFDDASGDRSASENLIPR